MVKLSYYQLETIQLKQFFLGLKNAHIKDGAALCSYFAWLEENISSGNLTEISVAEKLLSFRR